MDVSIIIPNWNTANLTYNCLKSIFLFTQDLEYEIIAVDNNSGDDSVQILNALTYEHQNLTLIINNKNLGFSKANNQGLAIAKGKYILFMNSDMELIENTPKILSEYLEEHQDVGACACQLQYGDGSRQPNIKRHPSFLSQLWILYKLHHLWQPAFLKKYLAKDFNYAGEAEVEQIMGAFVFIRYDIIKNIGGWSEDYFIWWEDLDLCKRLHELGEKIMYTPISRVVHYEGKSFARQMSLIKQKRFTRGMLTYFKKYHSKAAWIILWLARFDALILAWLAQVFKIKPKTQSRL